MTKKNIRKYSDPEAVLEKGLEKFGPSFKLYYSQDKDKKYSVINPSTSEVVSFGQMGYEDYTKHQDAERRQNFKSRNADWRNQPKYSPAYLSYHLLW